MGIEAAIIGSAVLGAGAGIYGASKSSSAIKGASKDATAAEMEMFYQSREDQAPWMEAGKNALTSLTGGHTMERPSREAIEADLLAAAGFGPQTPSNTINIGLLGTLANTLITSIKDKKLSDARADIRGEVDAAYAEAMKNYDSSQTQGLLSQGPGDFQSSPEYGFIREQGMKGIERGASAMGGLRSGAHLKAAGEYASNLANMEINDFNNRWLTTKVNPLMQVAGLGQVSSANLGNQAVHTGQSIGQNTLLGGQAQAAGTMGSVNSITNNMQWGAGQLLDYYNYNKQRNTLSARPGDF